MTPDRWVENPFFVLGLGSDAASADIEREGRRLLAQLELGLESVLHYDTPFGRRRRTPELVRLAMAQLRDPETRLLAELWSAVPLGSEVRAELEPWPDAMSRMSWRRPRPASS